MKRFVGLAFLSTLVFAMASVAHADSTSRLAGNHPVEAEQRIAIGNLDASQPLAMEIHLKLRNQSQLQAFLDQLQDPQSPNYHKFLQPGEFDSQYGPRQADLDAVAKWLRDEGFTVTSTAGSVQFTGTVEQAERTFTVHILKMSASEYANIDDPMLPASIAPMVGDIEGLDNLMASSPVLTIPANLKKLNAATAASRSHKLTRKEALASVTRGASPLAQPAAIISDKLAYGDVDMRNTYGVSSSTTMGSGDCIAVVGQSDYLDDSLTAFRTQFSDLPAFNVTRKLVGANNPGTGNGAEVETDLDLEWSHVMAPGAPTNYYFGSGNLQNCISQAVNDDACKVISVSFEFCGSTKSFYTNTLDPIFKKAASQGQSVFISSGDHGAAGSVASGGHCVPGSGDPLVSEMSADPNVTSVGGTQILSPDYVNGIAQGYATETVWNDAQAGLSANGATGGGASSIFSKPSYQSAPGVPSDNHRDVPDVVLLGGSPAVFIGGNSAGSGDIECCIDGTSLAAPLWAGLAKDIESEIGALGTINAKLYTLGSLQYGASATDEGFHDITSGDNNFNGVKGFSAGTGYDKASGLGSVDFGTFKTAFETAPAAPPTTMTVTPTSNDFLSLDATSTSRPKKVVVKNIGTSDGIIGAVALSGTNSGDFKISSDKCSGQTIKPKRNCVVMVEFAPATPIGAESASLNVTFNGGPVNTSLAGNSTTVMVSATPPTITYPPGPAGTTSAPKAITFTNHSKTVNVMLGAVPTPVGPFGIVSDMCSGALLGHGKRCTVKVVAIRPTPGVASTNSLPITGFLWKVGYTYGSNSGQTNAVTLTGQVTSGNNDFNGVSGLSAGTGRNQTSRLSNVDVKTAFKTAPAVSPTTMTVTPTSINFGSLDATSTSRPKKVVVKNTGTSAGIIGAVALSGTNSGDFKISSDRCSGQTIKPKRNCVVMVEFAPATPIGAESASLDVPFNGGPVSTALVGNSTPVVVTATPASITFPPTSAGATSSPKPVTFTNTSKTANVTLGDIAEAGPFVIKSDACSKLPNHTLGHGKRCKITIVSNPPPDSPSQSQTFGGLESSAYTYGTNGGATEFVNFTGSVK